MKFSKLALANRANRYLRRWDMAVARNSDLWRTTNQLGHQPKGRDEPLPANPPDVRVFGEQGLQSRFDVSVVMTTILRPTIADALHSIFRQDYAGRVQTLIGVDYPFGDVALVETLCADMPRNQSVLLFSPGYSTSTRHGGLHPAWDGGVLRTILSYLAASHRVAYLDDDNWLEPNHLSSLVEALDGHDWAWSLRYYAHPRSRRVICPDVWESVGVDAGTQAAFGGWVDPNCVMLDKLRCEAVLRWWSIPMRNSPTGCSSDKQVFRILSSEFEGRGTGLATVNYALNESDPDNDARLERIGRALYEASGEPLS